MRLVLTAGFAVGIAFAQAPGDPPEVDPPDVKLVLKLAQDPAFLRTGEPIRLQLFFSSTSAGKYLVSTGSGMCGGDEMHLEPHELAAIPGQELRSMRGWAGSILSGLAPLTEEPMVVDCEINERFRFDHAGSFHLWVNSKRVSRQRGPREPGEGNVPILVRSTTIDFQILEADAAWQAEQLQEIAQILDSGQPESDKNQAARRLRFLNTRGAIQEMAHRFAGRDKAFSYEYEQGLTGAEDLNFAREQLERELERPDSFIDEQFLGTLCDFYYSESMNKSESGDSSKQYESAMQKASQLLLKSIPQKTDAARVFAIQTLLQRGQRSDSPELIHFLVEHFRDLDTREQVNLLEQAWEQLRGPGILPVLRAIATGPPGGDSTAWELEDKAVQGLLELAPSDAREVLLREIRNPHTGLKTATLARLEDATIPELDSSLLERLRGQLEGTAEGPAELTAFLIHRYATSKIYDDVREAYAKKAGLWACAIQSPLLAYVLRANEKDGIALIDQALSPKAETGCHHSLLRDVAALRWVPALEKTALARLWDADGEVAGSAAIVLGEHGAAESEAPLWKRFEAWSEQWQGRESELRFNIGGQPNPNWPQSVLEDNLAHGLIDGKAWELTGAQRSKIAGLCVTASCRSMATAEPAR
jgi:hypothetical protein